MKNLFSFLTLSVVCIALLLGGCNKKSEDVAPLTKTQLLSLSPWIFLSASAAGTDVTNNSSLTCFKDNIITFSSAGSVIVNEGSTICNPSTAGSFTWSFQSYETLLVLSAPLIPGGSSTFSLVSLNETNLIISQNVTIPPSATPVLAVFTFRH